MQYVNVQLEGSFDGDVTDKSGEFLFTTRRLGKQTIQATSIGFEAGVHQVDLTLGDTSLVHLTFREKYIEMEEVVVPPVLFRPATIRV